MQELMRYINSGVVGRAAELANLWSLLTTLPPESYILRVTGGPRSAVAWKPGSDQGRTHSATHS